MIDIMEANINAFDIRTHRDVMTSHTMLVWLAVAPMKRYSKQRVSIKTVHMRTCVNRSQKSASSTMRNWRKKNK